LSNIPRPRQKKVRRLRGECLIEGLPTDAGSAIPLDGLRLRLDLRLEPESAAATERSPLTERTSMTEPLPSGGRGFTQRLVQQARAVPHAYQRWAVLSGVGTLLVMVALWVFAAPLDTARDRNTATEAASGTGAASTIDESPPAPLDDSTRSSTASQSTAAPVPAQAAGAAPAPSPAVAPAVSVVPRAAVVSAARSTMTKPAAAGDTARAHVAHPTIVAVRPVVATTAVAKPRSPQKPTASRNAETDLLDLFADTK
jgi:hypothetical protein